MNWSYKLITALIIGDGKKTLQYVRMWTGSHKYRQPETTNSQPDSFPRFCVLFISISTISTANCMLHFPFHWILDMSINNKTFCGLSSFSSVVLFLKEPPLKQVIQFNFRRIRFTSRRQLFFLVIWLLLFGRRISKFTWRRRWEGVFYCPFEHLKQETWLNLFYIFPIC